MSVCILSGVCVGASWVGIQECNLANKPNKRTVSIGQWGAKSHKILHKYEYTTTRGKPNNISNNEGMKQDIIFLK